MGRADLSRRFVFFFASLLIAIPFLVGAASAQSKLPVPTGTPILDISVLLAYRMNGELMRVRDKGPLWIVYPQDQFPELRSKEIQSKWVWQIKELRVK